ncbi:MAG TPA: acyltransferase [Frankiaceae bacterium]|nr:acyltransferase [Frankiaceae bacterium]
MTVVAERRARAPGTGPAAARPDRAPGLDGLRAVAVLLVVAHHLVYRATAPPAWARGGFLGVDLFLVLSGYLITTSLLGESALTGRVRLPRFYARRFLRLVPALTLFAAAHVGYVAATRGDVAAELATWPWVFGNVVNWHYAAGGAVGIGLYPLWSLAVEEQFYLLWPPLLALVRRRRALVVVAAAGVAASAVLRAVLWTRTDPADFFRVYVRTDTRLDALLVGVLAALLAHRVGDRALRRAAPVAVVAYAVCVPFAAATAGWLYLGGFTGVALAAAVIVVAVARLDAGRALLGSGPLVAVGRGSYAVYLWHAFVIEAVWVAVPSWPVPARAGAALAVTAVAAGLSYYLVERHCLRAIRALRQSTSTYGNGVGLGGCTAPVRP